MDTFTIRDLRERTGSLIRDAEEGKLSIITKRGHPVILAVPFNEKLIEMGLLLNLAIKLYEQGILTLGKAAKVADQPLEVFIDKLGKLGISVVNYPSSDLEEEVKLFE